MPNYSKQYQKDLFTKYSYQFIQTLPSAFSNNNEQFYEIGSYLNNYFKWCK